MCCTYTKKNRAADSQKVRQYHTHPFAVQHKGGCEPYKLAKQGFSLSQQPVTGHMTVTQRQKMPWATQTHPCRKQHHNLWLRVSVRSVKRKAPHAFRVNSQYSTDPLPKEKECPVSSENALLWEVNCCKNLICTSCLPTHFLVVANAVKICQNPMLYNAIHPAQKNLTVTNRVSKNTG